MPRFKINKQSQQPQSTPHKRKHKPLQPKKNLVTKAARENNSINYINRTRSQCLNQKSDFPPHHVIKDEGDDDDDDGDNDHDDDDNDEELKEQGDGDDDDNQDENDDVKANKLQQGSNSSKDGVYKPVVKIKGIGEPCIIESFVLEQNLGKGVVSQTQNYGVKLARVSDNSRVIIKSIDSIMDRFGHDTSSAFIVKCELVKKYEMEYKSKHQELIPSNICVLCQSKSFLSCVQHKYPYCFHCYQELSNGIAAQSDYLDLPIMDSCPCIPPNTVVYRQKAMFCSMFKFFPLHETNEFVNFAPVLRDSIVCGGFVEYDWGHIAGKKQNSKNFMSKLHDIIKANIQPICETGAQRLWHIFAFHTRSNMVCFGNKYENSIDAFLNNIIRQLHTWVAHYANSGSEHLTEIIGCDLESMLSTIVKLGTQLNQFVLLFTKSTPFDEISTFTSRLRHYWHDRGMPMLQAYECALSVFNLEKAILVQFLPNKEAYTIVLQTQETQRCIVRQKYINGIKNGNVEILKSFESSSNQGDNSKQDDIKHGKQSTTIPTTNTTSSSSASTSSASIPTNPTQTKDICWHFLAGKCGKNEKCRFLHITPKPHQSAKNNISSTNNSQGFVASSTSTSPSPNPQPKQKRKFSDASPTDVQPKRRK